jgi:transglutaminase-like putative cysteine protease
VLFHKALAVQGQGRHTYIGEDMLKKNRLKHPKVNKENLREQNFREQKNDRVMTDISASTYSDKVARRKRRIETGSKPRRESLSLLMVVGLPLSWSVVAGFVSTTEFVRDYFSSFVLVFSIVGILGLIFTYKHVMRVALGVLGVFIIFTLVGFFYASEPPGLANEFAALLTNTFRYVIGLESHTMAYQNVVVWIVSILISLFVVIFVYYRFVFVVLFSVLSVFFTLLVTSVYFSYPLSFYVFIICNLVLLVRYMHQRSSEKATKKSPYARWIIPITMACFFLMGFAPIPEAGTMQGPVRTAILRPINFINDTFYNVTSRREFSIRQVGFGGDGGRLGGAAVANHEVFMRVSTDGDLPLYLTGATSDTYTGYSWENNFVDMVSVDFSLLEQNLELLERFINFDVRFSPLVTIDSQHIGWDFTLSESEVFITLHTGGIVLQGDVGESIETIIVSNQTEIVEEELIIEPLQEFRRYERLEVDVLHFRPSFVFYSGILQGISVADESIVFTRDREGRVTTNNRFQRNSRYEVLSSRINRLPHVDNMPPTHSFKGILEDIAYRQEDSNVERFTIEDGRITGVSNRTSIHLQLGDETHTISLTDLLDNYLIPRRDRIYQTYTQLPEEFPTRIRELAVEVTEGAHDNYHMMRMLEEYLNQNYSYTLSPVNPPYDQDFVYHFLFDTREGHCVYFATAFVTMARSLGMPARYVEGFLVNGVPSDEGQINVLNSMAHAWPEVYFEGYGWHPFEPTPASGLPQLREIPEGASSDWNPWMDPEFMGVFWDSDGEPLEGPGQESGQEGADVSAGGTGLGEEGFNLGFWTVVGWALLTLVTMIVVRALWVYLLNIGWRRKGNEGAVIHAFDSILSYLEFFNYQMRDGETAFSFMRRVCNKTFLANVEEKRRLERTVAIYGKARYSDLKISREERMWVEKTVRNLDSRTKSYLGYPKYYFYRYILARV